MITEYSFSPKIQDAAAAMRSHIGSSIDLFLIAGSGFRDAIPTLEQSKTLSMADLVDVPSPKVAGHGAHFVWGRHSGKTVLVATGRIHLYEGWTADDVVFNVRMASLLGAKGVILTNAAGSVDRKLPAGTLVLIKDQLNLTGHSCESGPGKTKIPFTDMTDCYDPTWRSQVLKHCKLPEGIYAGLTGPAYETMAETKMLALLGAHTVGMSTVQECIAARTLGIRVLGLSYVTNMAGGLGGPIDHADVVANAIKNKTLLSETLAAAIAAF